MDEPARLYLITPVLEDTAAFRPTLEAALSDMVDCVLLRFHPAVGREMRSEYVRLVQSRDIAALVDAEPREAKRLNADGVHRAADDPDLSDAMTLLKPDGIVGVGRVTSRDEAMSVGETGVDYLLFGEPRADGFVPPILMTLDQVRWWAEVFTVPCVAYADALDDVSPLVDAGADFVALGDVLWRDPRGPQAVMASLKGVLSRRAFA